MRGEIRPTQPQPIASEPPLGRRRRLRQEGATAKQPALPALSAQDYAQIRELAAQMAGETAQHFVDRAVSVGATGLGAESGMAGGAGVGEGKIRVKVQKISER